MLSVSNAKQIADYLFKWRVLVMPDCRTNELECFEPEYAGLTPDQVLRRLFPNQSASTLTRALDLYYRRELKAMKQRDRFCIENDIDVVYFEKQPTPPLNI
jgi:hypothetical protein